MAFGDGLSEIAPFLAQKYRILGQQADAATITAGANVQNANANLIGKQAGARLDIANSREIAPNAIANRGMVGAQTKGVLIDNQKNTNLLPVSEYMGQNAPQMLYGQVGLGNMAPAPALGAPAPSAVTPFRFGAGGLFSDTAIGGAATSTLKPYDKPVSSSLLDPAEKKYAKGTAKVPGKGSGKVDTVKAKLAPGEAVLNKGAAEHIGRDFIEHINQIGLQKMGMPAAGPAKGKGKGMPAKGERQGFAMGTSNVQPLEQAASGNVMVGYPEFYPMLALGAP